MRVTFDAFKRLDQTRVVFWGFMIFMALFFLVEDRLQRNFYYLLLFLSLFPAFRSLDWRRLLSRKLLVLLSLWLIYLVASPLWGLAADPLGEFFEHLRRALLILSFVVMIVFLRGARDDFDLQLARTLGVAAAIGAVLSLVVYWSGGQAINPRLILWAQRGDIIFGATIYSVAALFLFGHLMRRDLGMAERVLSLAGLLVILFALYLTQSRGALLALLVALGLVAVMSRRAWAFYLLALLITAGAIAAVVLQMDPTTLLVRADSGRFGIWREAWAAIEAAPLLGMGLEHGRIFGVIDGVEILDPHNIFLANQLFGGLLASLLMGLCVASCAMTGLREWRSGRATLLLPLLVLALVTGAFHFGKLVVNASAPWVFWWLFLALAVACDYAETRRISAGK